MIIEGDLPIDDILLRLELSVSQSDWQANFYSSVCQGDLSLSLSLVLISESVAENPMKREYTCD